MTATQVFLCLVGVLIVLAIIQAVCSAVSDEVQARFGDAGTLLMNLAILWGLIQAIFWVGSKLHDVAMAIPTPT